jgi:hypothetical protein
MDEQQQAELKWQKQLEAERQKLTEKQRQRYDSFCALLKANETYSPRFAIEGAQAVHAFYGTQKLGSELAYIAQRAEHQGFIEQRAAFAEADKQKELQAQKAEQERAEREAQALAARKAAQREPLPNAMQRFNALLAESKVERTHAANIERAAGFAKGRPNYARLDVLKNGQEPGSKKDSPLLDRGQNRPAGTTAPAQPAVVVKNEAHPLKAEWRNVAHEVCDPRRPPNYRSGSGGGPPNDSPPRDPPPRDPTKPLASTNAPLSANEILARHSDPALQAREQKEREAKAVAAREAAQREPRPNAMQRFNALLAQRKAEREGQTPTSTQEQGSKKDSPLLDKGLDKFAGRGEISDARAARAEGFVRVVNNPSRDKDFDPSHDPGNSRNFSNGRGGRSAR